jgi:hypothetical protein
LSKKFVVPDSAITENGRLLQCGSCGNKWTQYPIKEKTAEPIKKEKIISKISKVENKIIPVKKIAKKKKRQINLYSEEYLAKKHGLTIKDNSSIKKNQKNQKNQKNKKYGLGFYGWVLIIVIFSIFIHGILNLNQNFIIEKFPASAIYINYFFEVHEMIKVAILELFN